MIKSQREILIIGPYKKKLKGGIYEVIKAFNTDNQKQVYNTIFSQNNLLNTLLFFLNIPRFLWIAKRFQIFHIHASVLGSFYRKSILIFLLKKLFSKKKIVLQIHSGYFIPFYNEKPFQKKWINWIFRNVDALLFITKSQYTYFSSLEVNSNIQLINNPILRRKASQKLFNHTPLKILFLGKISKQKGVYDLIDITIKLKNTLIENIEFLVAGVGEVDEFKRQIEKYDLSSIVKYIGWVNAQEKEQFLKNSDLLILPSYSEAMPISILEGMSFGLPIIATRVGAIPELVTYKNGFLFSPGNLDELASCLSYCINHKEELAKLSTHSYLQSQKYFVDKVECELYQIYKKL